MSILKKVLLSFIFHCLSHYLFCYICQGGRLDGEWETDFEDLGLSKKEREKRKKDQELKERDEFPEKDQKYYWWKASLTRRAKDGPGNQLRRRRGLLFLLGA